MTSIDEVIAHAREVAKRNREQWKNCPADRRDIEHLTEEMADVLICIELLKQMFGINESELQAWIDLKQKRNVERMKGEPE